MEFPILRRMGMVACAAMFVEDGKQEGAVVKSAVFNCVVEFRNLRSPMRNQGRF
jgi:hypothetical protein